MSLIEEIERFMNTNNASLNYRYLNIGGNNLYVEGIKGVINLGTNLMQFQIKNQMIEIQGEGLKIKYLDKTTAIITGKILMVEVK